MKKQNILKRFIGFVLIFTMILGTFAIFPTGINIAMGTTTIKIESETFENPEPGDITIPAEFRDGSVDNDGLSVVAISAGEEYSLAIKSDGSLWAWGYNEFGQLGDGTKEDRLTPVKIMDDVKSISAGKGHSLAIKNDGSLWAWGANADGQLGDGTTENRLIPLKIMDGVITIGVGWYHSLAIKSDGSLWAWGLNIYGQLGDGTTENKSSPVKIMDEVTAISTGFNHSMAIKSEGSLWAWGLNANEQLGDGTWENKSSPVKVMDGITAITAGGAHNMTIKNDGSLWTWGWNEYGGIGDGTTEHKTNPVKVMNEVMAISIGAAHSIALTNDSYLWTWGANWSGQLGDGTTENKSSPVKIMDDISAISAGGYHTMAIKSDGSLWTWGRNGCGQLGDGTTKNKLTPVQIIIPSESTTPNINTSYNYNTITDEKSAIEAIKSTIDTLSDTQKEDVAEIDLLTVFTEEAIAQASSKTISGGGIVVNQTNVQDLQSQALSVKTAAEKVFTNANIDIMREINADVKFKTSETAQVTITVEPSAADTTADNVRVETSDYAVSIPKGVIVEGTKSGSLVITIEEVTPVAASVKFAGLDVVKNMKYAANTSKEKQYKVTLNKNLKENIKYSFEPASGDVDYQCVMMSNGTPVGGKYNPVTKKIDTRIRISDTYTVKENKKNFSDISSKSTAMQNAINILASKGIINGTTSTTFNPDGAITRAEIAALIVRTLSKLDENADGGFTDIKKTDWYFGAVGSAKSYGIINGMSETTFAPKSKIQKDQIIAIAARTLRSEMKWNNPKDTDKYLKKFTDKDKLPSWGTDDFALASMADLIVLRTDGKFNPSDTMTRGDAVIVLYRLFMKIW